MKKIALITSFTVTVVSVVIVLSAYFINNAVKKNNTKSETEYTPEKNIRVSDTTPIPERSFVTSSKITGYMIKSNYDSINIYEIYDNGHYKIIDTLPVNPNTLPKADSQKLKKGIVTQSYEQMCHIIEDYSS